MGQINLSRNNCDLFLHKTKLGWIIGGEISSKKMIKRSRCFLSGVEFDLERFWQLEECDNKNNFSVEELKCEEHFKKHTRRDASGRYVVALPFKDNYENELGDSKNLAHKRLNSLLKRFAKNKEFEIEYTKEFTGYIELGHMSMCASLSVDGFYISHHAVIKETSETTKTRIVLDGSAETTSGKSLNDVLMTGPTI